MLEALTYICVAATPVSRQQHKEKVGEQNRFCGARPILSADDYTRPEPDQFRYRQLAFWLVADHAIPFAEVGRVFRATLTPSPADTYRSDDLESDVYRVRPDSVMALDGEEFCEIVRVQGKDDVDLQQVLRSGRFNSARPLGNHVILRCGSFFTAPMKIEPALDSLDRFSTEQGASPTAYTLLPNPKFSTAFREISAPTLTTSDSHYFQCDVLVLPPGPLPLAPGRWGVRSRTDGQQISVEFAGPNFIKQLTTSERSMSTLNLGQALALVSTELRLSGSRSEVADVINKYNVLVASTPPTPPFDQIRALLANVKNESLLGLPELNQLATSLFNFPAVVEKFNKIASDKIALKIAQTRESTIAQIEASLQGKRAELAQLQETANVLQSDMDRNKREQDLAFSTELKRRFENERKAMDTERASLDAESRSLEVAKHQVESTLSVLVDQYKEVSPIITGSVLATLRVLESNSGRKDFLDQPPPAAAQTPLRARLRVPPLKPSASAEQCGIQEAQFLQRVHHFAARQGLTFQEHDVKMLHIALKSDPFVVLRGAPGAGKTSLARAYSNALAGTLDQNRVLEIAVNPNWIEQSDLFGFVHSIKQAFVPSPSGVSQFLASLREESFEHGLRAPMAVVLLDEMNLSQPELYLPMNAIWHSNSEQRLIRLFDPSAVLPDEPLLACHSITIAPNVKFIGTINVDDTVKPLSPRFLDRVFAIEISSDRSGPQESGLGYQQDSGQAIDSETFSSWSKGSRLSFPQGIVKVFEQAQKLVLDSRLTDLSHRTRDALVSFVANSANLLDESNALDCGIASRVVSKIRGAKSSREYRNLNALHQGLSPESSAPFLMKLSATPVFWRITLSMQPNIVTV